MIAFMLGTALAASTATLHVGVHVAAGSLYDIAADGASGLCAVGPSWISCPATGPVTFRWGPGGHWVLTGQTVVQPGEVAVAFVLAPEEDRVEQRELLAARPLEPEVVRRLFLRTGADEAPPPSQGMIDDLVALSRHPDPRVRAAVVDALTPFWRHTASDPFPATAPDLVPDTLIASFAGDQDHRVRRRIAVRLRDLREPSPALAVQARDALSSLVSDERSGVQRAATASLTSVAAEVGFPAERSWDMAMDNVTREGAPGRAAANTLRHLHPYLEAAEVDALEAVALVLRHHRERTWPVWSAWRAEVPFRRDWVDTLLRETAGLDRRLLAHWASVEPAQLAAALEAWEPVAPHSERWGVVQAWLSDTKDDSLRRALGLPPIPATSDNVSASKVAPGPQ